MIFGATLNRNREGAEMNKQISKSLYAAAFLYSLSPFPLREYGASQTRVASQSTPPFRAHTDRLRRIRGKVDDEGLGYG